MIIHDMT